MAIFWYDWPAPAPDACRGAVLTVGNFDGVHRGHAALVASARELARASGRKAVAVTFDPHPLALLRPQDFRPVLTTTPARAELLHEVGIDEVLILRTTPTLLQLDARTFFQEVIRGRLGAAGIVEGANFCFGRGRSGTIETLAEFCAEAGLRLVVVPPQMQEGVPISSSRVRNALTDGDVALAARLLGRPYRLHGEVVTGQRRGRTLGFPTANLGAMPTVLPAEGVYAVRCVLPQGTWPGAANVGPNPTFGEQERKVEVHLIGYEGDLYGQALAVDFVARLRATRPFASIQELRAQLDADVAQVRSLAAPGEHQR